MQRLLGVLLHPEIDRELNVLTRDGLDPTELAHHMVGAVDLVDHLAPRAVQRFLHALFNTELSYGLVVEVSELFVLFRLRVEDETEITNHVARQRSVRIHPAPVFVAAYPRVILTATLDLQHQVFGHVFT